MKRLCLIVATALILGGCGSFSGLDAKNKFGCKAPDGVLCESMTGIYANAVRKNLPGQAGNKPHSESPVAMAGVLTRPIDSGTPIRSTPRVLRIWFAPWEDSDGDLHEQSYVYLTIDSGRWLIEHNQQRIREQFQPIQPPVTAPSKEAPVPSAESPSNPGETNGR